jgi:serine/threonine-protein kinase RsbW
LKEIIVPNDLAEAKRPEEQILNELESCGYDANSVFAVKLALEEAVTNAFRHGNKCDPCKRIVVRYKITPDQAIIDVCDEGCGFEPGEVPDPTLPEFIDRPHGRGIMLMKAYLDEVSFTGCGNSVRLVKNKK